MKKDRIRKYPFLTMKSGEAIEYNGFLHNAVMLATYYKKRHNIFLDVYQVGDKILFKKR